MPYQMCMSSIAIVLALNIGIFAAQRTVDPALPFDVAVSWSNFTGSDAKNVTIEITIPQVTEWRNLPSSCTASGDRVVCSIGDVPSTNPASPWPSLHLFPVAPPDASGATTLTMTAEIRAPGFDAKSFSSSAATFRTFYVTNRNDAGDGSLRSAIDAANVRCGFVPCKVAFRIDGPGPWQTIRPESPLPAATGVNLSIDGRTQTAFFGDTNPDGPEIEINGANAGGGASGIELATACSAEVHGLTINGFAANGVLVSPGFLSCAPDTADVVRRVAESYIGTDPTGMNAVPNTRGVFLLADADVANNVISGNTRSGVFNAAGRHTLISGNTIGLDAKRHGPLGNGASGVYVGRDASGSDVMFNMIGFNHDFGVALHADEVAILGNSIQANWQLGIDHGLDGVTPAIAAPAAYGGGTIPMPEITAARFDPATGDTTIEGTVDAQRLTYFVEVYANDEPDPSGYGEGQYWLGRVDAQDGRFTFAVHGDWSGKWASATATRYYVFELAKPPASDGIYGAGFATETSEFGRDVEVTRVEH